MTLKDLVTTHQRVKDRHDNVIITVSLYYANDEIPLELSGEDAIRDYGNRKVVAWMQTSKAKYDGYVQVCEDFAKTIRQQNREVE